MISSLKRALKNFTLHILLPLSWALQVLYRLIHHTIFKPLIQWQVYPKAFQANAGLNVGCADKPEDILDERSKFCKLSPHCNGRAKEYDMPLPCGITLRGIRYVPSAAKDESAAELAERGFIWFEGTNSSSIQTHISGVKEMAEKTGKVVIGCDHRGIGWSDGDAHWRLGRVLEDVKWGIDNEIKRCAKLVNQSAEEYAQNNVLLYGHSLGGGISVALADRLHREGKRVKAFSWASYASLGAVPRELFGRLLLKIIFAFFLTMMISSKGISSIVFSSVPMMFLSFAISAIVAHFLIEFDPGVLLPLLEYLFIHPMMWLAGWQLDVVKSSKKLYHAGYLDFGHIMRDPGPREKNSLFKFLSATGEDGFIPAPASLPYAMRDEIQKKVNEAETPEDKASIKGAYAINSSGTFLSPFYSHTLGIEDGCYFDPDKQCLVPQLDRLQKLIDVEGQPNRVDAKSVSVVLKPSESPIATVDSESPALAYFTKKQNGEMQFKYHYLAALQLKDKVRDFKQLFTSQGQPIAQNEAVLFATGASSLAVSLFDCLSCLNFLILTVCAFAQFGYLPMVVPMLPYLYASSLAAMLYTLKVYWATEVNLEVNKAFMPAASEQVRSGSKTSKLNSDHKPSPANVFAILPF